MNAIYPGKLRGMVFLCALLAFIPSLFYANTGAERETVSFDSKEAVVTCPDVIIINAVLSLPTGYIILDDNNDTVAYSALGAPLSACNLNIGQQYRLRPYRPGIVMDEVSTFDLLNISRHLLGYVALESIDRILAGDVNKSTSLSVADMLNIQYKIFDEPIVLSPDVLAWQFVSKEFVTNFPQVPPAENMLFTYTGPGQILEIIEIKTGRTRHESKFYETNFPYKGTLFFEVDNIFCVAGAEYDVDIRVTGFTDIRGFQFALQFDPAGMTCLDVIPKEVNYIAPKLGLAKMSEGIVRTNWVLSHKTDLDVADGEQIITVKVQALKDGKLSDFLSIDPNLMRAEGYDKNDDFYDVDFLFIPKFKGNDAEVFYSSVTESGLETSPPPSGMRQGSPDPDEKSASTLESTNNEKAESTLGKPVADCVQIREVILMPSTGMSLLSTLDIESGNSFDATTPYEDLIFKIEQAKFIKKGQIVPGASANEYLPIDCSYMPPITPSPLVPIALWVGNKDGEWDYCISQIYINEKYGVCCNNYGSEIEVVQVNGESGGEDLCPYSTIHSTNGLETVSLLCENQAGGVNPFPSFTHVVEPYRNNTFLAGVSSYDLLLILKHLSGVKILDNPYQRIAADINNDCNISISDYIALRKMILNPLQAFEKNTSWRFVDADYIFPDPEKPCNFKETVTYGGMWVPMFNAARFFGVKIGNINYGYSVNNFKEKDVSGEVRMDLPAIDIAIPNISYEHNTSITVPLTLSNETSIEGYQYALRFDPDKLAFDGLEIQCPELAEYNFGLSMAEEGLVLVSWVGEDVTKALTYNLRFRTKSSGQLRDVLSLSDQYLNAEAYGKDELVYPVVLQFEGDSKAISELSVSPNPFQSDLKVIYQLSEPGDVHLSFSDVLGRVLHQQKAEGKRGLNELIIDGHLWPTGTLFYTLEQNGQRETRFLIRE